VTHIVSTNLLHTTLKNWAETLAKKEEYRYSGVINSGVIARTDLHKSCSGFFSFVDAGAEVWFKLNHTQCMQKSRAPYLREKAQRALEYWKEDFNRSELSEAKKETFVILKVVASVDNESDLLEFRAYYCFDEHGRDSIPWLRYMGGTPDQTNPATNDFYASVSLNEYDENGEIRDGYILKESIEIWLDRQTVKAFKELKRIS
jgi:hypothetical protein